MNLYIPNLAVFPDKWSLYFWNCYIFCFYQPQQTFDGDRCVMKFLAAHILTVFYCYIKFNILITIEINLCIVGYCLYFKSFAIWLTGNVPLVYETSIWIDRELLVTTCYWQYSPMGEGTLRNGNNRSKWPSMFWSYLRSSIHAFVKFVNHLSRTSEDGMLVHILLALPLSSL